MSGNRRQVVSGTITAAPEQVFAVLADPARHTEIDGAGMLQGTRAGKPITGVGESFLMDMNQEGLGDYQMRNEIIAFEPGRRIAWAPAINDMPAGMAEMLGDIDFSGYHYAWDLAPTAEGHTEVTHTCDWSGVKDERAVAFFPRVTSEQMAQTIARIAATVG
ncbi:MAG: SRPBCC family protein [Acidimicrobiia bacterium]